MFDTPRCREWTPLATQQLRLRNLIQIVGYNIRPPERCSSPPDRCCYYYTLHETTTSPPFYTSERIASPHPKWRELHGDVTQRKASTNVVIRIWCHAQQSPDKDLDGDPGMADPSDLVIQTWGVYFNGLRLIGANLALDFTSDSFKFNTLVFQMHGGYFCSYKSLNLEVIPTENLYEYSLSSGSSSNSSQRIPIQASYLQNHRIIKESRSISPGKRSFRNEDASKSISPTDRTFRQVFTKTKPIGLSLHRKTEETYPNSPENDVKVFTMSDSNCDLSKHPSKDDLYDSNIDLSETAESYDLKQDGVPKCRYLSLNFLKSEIRPSYNATKLQELHLLQYAIKKRKDSVMEIKEKIYRKSPIKKEISPDCDLTMAKARRTERNLFDEDVDREEGFEVSTEADERINSASGPRTLKLNDLLSFKSHPSPSQRLEHARLTKRLEILRFRRRLLADERDAKVAAIARLKERHAKIFEENQDIGSELMTGYHALSRRTERLRQSRQSTEALRQLVSRAQNSLRRRRHELPCELAELFRIECDADNKWWICDVHMPVFDDDTPKRVTRTADAVAAGYAAHCTQVAAGLIEQPLRYKIRAKGSESIIYDELTQELTDTRIPLYPRGGDPALFRYGVFLLNKNVAQLLWGRGMAVCDIRPTLANLKRLITSSNLTQTDASPGDSAGCLHSQSLRSLVASERGQPSRQFNRFKDSVDGHSPASEFGLRRHRPSRSVGSYRDDREMKKVHLSTESIMGSVPFLHEANSSDDLKPKCLYLKQHNSDSQISRLSSDVTFTMGGEPIEQKKIILVKMSSNNGDFVVKNEKTSDKDDCEVVDCKGVSEVNDLANDVGCDLEGNESALVNNDKCDNVEANISENTDSKIVNVEDCTKNKEAAANFNLDEEAVHKSESKLDDNNECRDANLEIKSKSLDSDKASDRLMPIIVEKVMAIQNANAVKEIELSEIKNCDCQEMQFTMDDAVCSSDDFKKIDKHET